jgi:hypothetical protein
MIKMHTNYAILLGENKIKIQLRDINDGILEHIFQLLLNNE